MRKSKVKSKAKSKELEIQVLDRMSSQLAAKLLGKSDQTLRRFRMNGVGPPYGRMESGTIYYRRSDLEQWLAGRVKPASEQLADREIPKHKRLPARRTEK